MNIVNTIARAGYEFLVINIVAIPFVVGNPWTIAWYVLCVALAFLLRVGMEHKEHRLTWASLLYQSICTIGWSFFSVLCWDYFFTDKTKGIEIYLFVNSLFATFMVSQFEDIGKSSIKKWLAAKVGTILATEKQEEKS